LKVWHVTHWRERRSPAPTSAGREQRRDRLDLLRTLLLGLLLRLLRLGGRDRIGGLRRTRRRDQRPARRC
jgi:hypothetical protein